MSMSRDVFPGSEAPGDRGDCSRGRRHRRDSTAQATFPRYEGTETSPNVPLASAYIKRPGISDLESLESENATRPGNGRRPSTYHEQVLRTVPHTASQGPLLLGPVRMGSPRAAPDVMSSFDNAASPRLARPATAPAPVPSRSGEHPKRPNREGIARSPGMSPSGSLGSSFGAVPGPDVAFPLGNAIPLPSVSRPDSESREGSDRPTGNLPSDATVSPFAADLRDIQLFESQRRRGRAEGAWIRRALNDIDRAEKRKGKMPDLQERG
ncbi:hypothetical protein QQZ08_010081 [Neonectria magnoliae]|uniref:Uncharacterized protein n=1 Tax=Neonectria magnoliae TaxID=2732573 RepID=A0ABR1HJ84_9HYPO